MTMFWITATALLVVALLLVVLPLVRTRPEAPTAAARPNNLAILREQLNQLDTELADGLIEPAQHAAARREIERRVLDEESEADAPARSGRSTKTAVLMALAVPLLAGGLYARIGNPLAITAPGGPQAPGEVSAQDVDAMLAKLAARMEEMPNDVKGWTLLGRTYAALQRFPEADKAYRRALGLTPDDAQLLADHADVIAMTQGGSVAGAPEKLLARALQIEPTNVKALALAGSAAFERGDFPVAIAHWTKARGLAPAGSEFAAGLDRSLEEARMSAGRPSMGGTAVAAASAAAAAAPAPVAASGNAPAAGTAKLSGQVTLAPALAAQVAPGDTVFVFARAAEGPRMPLAIVRRTVAELPFKFTLDDSQAMSPAMKLSNFPNVVIGARISKSGNAMPQPGDLTGQLGPVNVGAQGLALVIDGVQK